MVKIGPLAHDGVDDFVGFLETYLPPYRSWRYPCLMSGGRSAVDPAAAVWHSWHADGDIELCA